jgi:ribose transport system substrate-binding protein
MNRSTQAIGGAALVAVLLAAAACSSSGSTSATSGTSSAGSTSNTGAAAAQATSSPALKQLQAKVDASLKAPTGIGLQTPLTSKPAAGKSIVGLLTPLAVAQTESNAQAQAAKMLGWSYRTVQEGTGPQDPAQALNAAIVLRPSGIIYYGTPRQPMASALTKAQAAGIPVVATAQVDPLAPPIIANNSNSGPQLSVLGSGVADYVAVNSDLKASVALVTLPSYPVLASFDTGFTKELSSVCAGCSVTQLPQQLTDIGTSTPTAVVNAIRRNPSIKYVIFDTGSVATGVEDALKAAGLSSVVVGGESPDSDAIQQMKSGSNQAWAALSIPIAGFQLMDALARHFDGDSLTPVTRETPPWQILTSSNIGSAVLDSKDNYVGYANYVAAFAKLWNVG